ncbi:MAG: hypothetical protein JWP29_2423 [Rhodoferax sp.]|nr:hypothetical protein [Rhodoferax sp.]
MDSAPHLPAQLAQLQRQYEDLQAEHEALQARHQAQRASADAWLAQRTRELEAEAAEQKKSESLQRVFYRIAERAAAGLSFYDFLQTGHQLLGELLYAKNCYICLYNAERQTLNFPYYVDERDGDVMQADHVPLRRGLTEFVLRTERPQLIDAARFRRLQASGEITEATGDLSFVTWLGVPMQLRGAIGGALVIQSYAEGVHYTDSDADVLAFVANHFSSAIERYQAIDALHKSEERYRTVIENAGVGVVVVQDERMVFGNPRLARIVGHPLDYLLSQPFTRTLHPDDALTMVQRHRRRLRGEPVEPHFSFRIITRAGQVRWLDLSAVKIEWEKADATLLFVVDATARVEAEQAQRITLQKQVELNETKSRFISMTSHEFRTPLAIIHGSVELLRHYEDRLPADKKRLAWTKIEDAVDRMTRMLEHVQAIGHAQAEPLECKPVPVDLADFCAVLLDELRSVMGVHCDRVTWQVELPPGGRHYLLDEALIRKIVGNLLSNAVKYSPDGGVLRFSAREAEGQLLFCVADQGIGIPEQDQASLFQSFYRASNVGPIVGTGLGLSIVKEAVACHKGRISVSSAVGQGSCFTVVLPLWTAGGPSPLPLATLPPPPAMPPFAESPQ